MAVKHGLGRGLNALIKEVPPVLQDSQSTPPVVVAVPATAQMTVPVDRIRVNPLQPRKNMAPEPLEDLVQSIRAHGVLQPLIVRRIGDQFELIAGERRLRASRQLGLTDVPVVVKELITDQDTLEVALVENLQREDLNAIEEAEGYRQLAEKFVMNQDDIAKRVGKARATVTNSLRILSLPSDVKQMVVEGKLSSGHAKALLGVEIAEERSLIARRAIAEGWSVRMMEKAVARLSRAPRKPRSSRVDIPASHLQYLSDKLHRHFGTSVRIFPPRTMANGKKVKGSIEIDFFSNEDLTRLLDVMGIAENV
jgi:ParB family chromosome partitioning protein